MSKVVITLTGTDDSPHVDVDMEFDPPMKPSDTVTPATHGIALRMLEACKHRPIEEDDEEDADSWAYDDDDHQEYTDDVEEDR